MRLVEEVFVSRFTKPACLGCLVFILLFCGRIISAQPLPEAPLEVPLGVSDGVWALGALEPGKRGGQLTVSVSELPPTLDPLTTLKGSPKGLSSLFMGEGLVSVNSVNGRIVPGLAKSWEISDDGLIYTFHLRQGIKFSDGQPITAADVVYTYRDVLFDPQADAPLRESFLLDGKLPEVTQIDSSTVQFKLSQRSGPFLRKLAVSILPQHVFADLPAHEIENFWSADLVAKDPTRVVGAGPFRVASYMPGEKLALERNPFYYKVDPEGTRLPYFDTCVVLEVPDRELELLKFVQGQLDVFFPRLGEFPFLWKQSREGEFILRIENDASTANSDFIAFNWDIPDSTLSDYYQDYRFRRALSLAIDRQEIVQTVYRGFGVVQNSPISQLSSYYNPEVQGFYPANHDPAAARALLQEIKLTDKDGDGTRESQDEKDLSFALLTGKENHRRLQMARIIAADLRRVGLAVEVKVVSFDSLIDRILTGDFEAALVGMVMDPFEPDSLSKIHKSDGRFHFWHRSGAKKPTSLEQDVDLHLKEGALEPTFRKRNNYYDRFQILYAQKLPLIYTVGPAHLRAHKKSLENTEEFNSAVSPLRQAEYLWENK